MARSATLSPRPDAAALPAHAEGDRRSGVGLRVGVPHQLPGAGRGPHGGVSGPSTGTSACRPTASTPRCPTE